MVKCSEVLQCNDATNNVSNIIIRHIDNRKLLLVCILLLLHSLIYFRFLFYKNMVVIYVFLLEEAMYSYCCLCILIVRLCILIVVYVLLLLIYVFLSLSMCCLYILRCGYPD